MTAAALFKTMDIQNLITAITGAVSGMGLMKVIDYFWLNKKDSKQFDQKLRDELWDRIKNLEGRLDEQNRMLLEVMKENAAVKFENERLQNEIQALRATA